MAAVSLLVRARLRHRWRAWLSLGLLIALVSGLVLAAAAAGRRTATAFPRFAAAYGYDAFVLAEAPIPKIAALPGVTLATPLLGLTGGQPACTCSHPINNDDFTLFEVPPRDLPRGMKLLAGRMPDPSDPDQVLASLSLQQDAGVRVGTVIRVPLFAAAQRGALLSGGNIRPAGQTVALRVVGIDVTESDFPATGAPAYGLFVTRAFARAVNPGTVVFPGYLVRLRHGAASLPRFQARARTLGALSVNDLDTGVSAVQSAILPQAVGWWILAGLTALAGIIVLGQALARQARTEAGAYGTLSALGLSRRQLVALGMTTTLLVAAGGVTGGVALAFALSPLTPVGEARIADPSPGFAFDASVLLPGAVAVVAVLLALGLWPAVRTARSYRLAEAPPPRPSPIVARLARAGAPPTMLIGVRHAVARGRGAAAVPVGPALAGSILAVAALCATAVFGASLAHLTSTPALYGQPFDLAFTPDGPQGVSQVGQLLAHLERDRAIADVSAGTHADVSINGRTVDAMAALSVRGPLLFTTITGHLPQAGDQVVLGTTTLQQLGARIGSLVRVTMPGLRGGTRAAWFRVTGTAVFPPTFSTQLGTGAIFTVGGWLGGRCVPGPTNAACQLQAVFGADGGFLVRAVPGPRGRAALTQLARAYPFDVNFLATPAGLVNFGEVNFPLIFGLVLALFGAAAVAHLLVMSAARRRPEIGLLKALGFVRRQAALAVSWQAATVALAGVVVGVPAGLVAGRLIWRVFAASLGVVAVPVVVAWVIVAVAAGTLIAATALAAGPAWSAARSRPAGLLRTE